VPITLESPSEILQFLIAAARARLPNANLVRWGGFYKRLAVVSLGIADLQYKLRQVQQDLDPLSALGTALKRIGQVFGVTYRGATGGAVSGGLRVFGDPGAVITADLVLVHATTGLEFETRSGGTIPAEGYLDVDIAATSTGVQTNLDIGEELQFQTPPTDVETVASVVAALVNGRDAEAEGDFRARLLDKIGRQERSGNRDDFEQWVLESAAYVASAYVYPHRNGLGTVDIAALKDGRGTARLLDEGERDEVLAYVDNLRMVTGRVRVLEVTTREVDVEILVKPESDSAYEFDWDDSTPPTVASYDSVTRTLTFQAARPASIAVGDRVVVKSADSDGSEFEVESLSSTDAVVLTEDLGFAPAVADPVYSGGPVVEAAREKIHELFDSLGPANPDDVQYGPWEGNLRIASLFETVQTSTGILDSDPAAPTSNEEAEDPAWPNNETVELLIAGRIIVRKDHS
jgi:uncharacterized phage protein gp47/JayE